MDAIVDILRMGWWIVPVGYVAGAVPWGLIVVQLTRRVDVRDVGSGKTGMTNVLRAAGPRAAIVVLLADLAKGLLTVLAARALTDEPAVHAASASMVIVGHIWPVFAGFRGGRGIATGFGTALGIDPWTTLIGLGVFLPLVGLTRIVSLGSVTSVVAVATGIVVRALVGASPMAYLWYAAGCGALIVWAHRDNIRRLMQGTERRIGRRSR